MTTCTIERCRNGTKIDLDGHAGIKGDDTVIICAAISTLVCTLNFACSGHKNYSSRGIKVDGEYHAAYTGCERRVFDFIDYFQAGMQLIARDYPDNVKLIIR